MLKAILTRSFLAATAAMTVAGCASSSVDDPQPADEKQEMRFAVNDVSSRALATNSTLTTEGSTFDVWGQMVRTQPTGGTRIKVFDGVTVTRTATDWTYDNPQYWFPGFTYDFKAIYSAGENLTTTYGDDGSLTVSNFDGTKGIDLLLANETRICPEAVAGGTTPMGTVDLKFRHQLSRVTFRGYSDEKLLGTGRRIVVTKIAVGGFASKGDVTVDGATGTATWTTDAIDSNPVKTISSETGIFLEYAGTDLFDGDAALLVIPQQIPDGAYVEITYKYNMGADYTHTARASLNNGGVTKWEAGKSYRYPFTFNEGIFWDLPTVDAWIDSPINGRPGFNIDIDNNSI